MVKNGLSNPDCSEEVSQAVLRFITFEILSLTHTCCRENKDFVVESFTTKDAAEIHGERWLFEDFEALMSSLKEESKQSDVLLWEFIQGDCSIWMREHLQSIHKLPFKGSLYAALAPDEYQAMESLYKTSLDTEMLANHPDYSDTLIPMLTEDHSDTDVSTHEPVPNGYKQFQWTCVSTPKRILSLPSSKKSHIVALRACVYGNCSRAYGQCSRRLGAPAQSSTGCTLLN